MRISCFFHFLKFFSDFHFIVLHNFVLRQMITVKETGDLANRHHNKEGLSAARPAHCNPELQVSDVKALVAKIGSQPLRCEAFYPSYRILSPCLDVEHGLVRQGQQLGQVGSIIRKCRHAEARPEAYP